MYRVLPVINMDFGFYFLDGTEIFCNQNKLTGFDGMTLRDDPMNYE